MVTATLVVEILCFDGEATLEFGELEFESAIPRAGEEFSCAGEPTADNYDIDVIEYIESVEWSGVAHVRLMCEQRDMRDPWWHGDDDDFWGTPRRLSIAEQIDHYVNNEGWTLIERRTCWWPDSPHWTSVQDKWREHFYDWYFGEVPNLDRQLSKRLGSAPIGETAGVRRLTPHTHGGNLTMAKATKKKAAKSAKPRAAKKSAQRSTKKAAKKAATPRARKGS